MAATTAQRDKGVCSAYVTFSKYAQLIA